jgi:bifunctional non-homologous end joining protein LigD
VIFDILYLEGQLTTELPYRERRELLERLDLDGPSWQTPAYQEWEGREFLQATAEHRLEGVLAKRLDSPYRPGERTEQWLKVKNVNRQELVIGGWLEGKGNRAKRLGALLMGYYEGGGRKRALRYAGRVGTGFDDAELERLTASLIERGRRASPFGAKGVQPPPGAHFVEPELVAEIEFSRWTNDMILRHSSYRGLRTDKAAREVELEELAGSGSSISATAPKKPDKPPAEKSKQRGTSRARDPRRVLPETERGERRAPYEVLRETKRHTEIEVLGRALRLSNRDKVMYPESGYTKGDLVDYYAAIAPVLLAHLAGRPLTLKRYPDGVDEEFFYEKRCPAHRPDWVQTAAIWSERERRQIDYCLVEDLPTLIWVANLASIELHTSLSLAREIEVPTALVFDLDPGEPAGLRECCKVALWIEELFESVGLQSLVKTSGAKGLQVYVPLNTPVAYEQTKPFAHAVARLLEHEHPEIALSRMARNLRAGKVLIDWSQNDQHKTTVNVYSLRARERPTISTPLSWEEVRGAASSRRRTEPQLSAEPRRMLERVERDGDLFAPLLSLVQRLPDFGRAEGILETAERGEQARGQSGPRRKAEDGYEATGRGSSHREATRSNGGSEMPPAGVRKGSKRDRQYKHVRDSEREQGASESRAEEIAARTVNKERARSGESRTRSNSSTKDISSGRRGGLRSGKPGPRGRTRQQLYQEARKLGVEGRSSMNKAQLQRAVDNKKR